MQGNQTPCPDEFLVARVLFAARFSSKDHPNMKEEESDYCANDTAMSPAALCANREIDYSALGLALCETDCERFSTLIKRGRQ